MKSVEKVILRCTDGGSDKEYQIELLSDDGGVWWFVNFRFGRRGGTLAEGTKTKEVVAEVTARKIFQKLIGEKIKKGYVVHAAQDFVVQASNLAKAAYEAADDKENKSPLLPQLCNPIADADLEALFGDTDWVAQEKMDGERRLVEISTFGSIEAATGFNRRGVRVELPEGIGRDVLNLYAHLSPCIIDGEIIGDEFFGDVKFYPFDAIRFHDDFSEPIQEGFAVRFRRLVQMEILNRTKHVRVVPISGDVKALLDKVKAGNGEGIVLKRRDSLYQPGRPNSGGDWLKFKFTVSASCVVLRNNRQRSVGIGVRENAASAVVVNVGNVTIPPNHEIPAPGDVVEVRYLYAYQGGGSLFQPVYLGQRTDVEMDNLESLKYKAKMHEE